MSMLTTLSHQLIWRLMLDSMLDTNIMKPHATITVMAKIDSIPTAISPSLWSMRPTQDQLQRMLKPQPQPQLQLPSQLHSQQASRAVQRR